MTCFVLIVKAVLFFMYCCPEFTVSNETLHTQFERPFMLVRGAPCCV